MIKIVQFIKNISMQQLVKNDHPDPKNHQTISFIKSFIRIAGYFLIPYSIPMAVSVLVGSEFIGIIEELV